MSQPIEIVLGAPWKAYTEGKLLMGGSPVGTICTERGVGALVEWAATGHFMQAIGNDLFALDDVAVGVVVSKLRSGSHGGPGRRGGRKAADGLTNLVRKTVSLDDLSIDTLHKIGGGDLSLGIRRAAQHVRAISTV